MLVARPEPLSTTTAIAEPSRCLPLFSTSDAGLHILPTDQEESDAVLEAHVWKPIWAKRSE